MAHQHAPSLCRSFAYARTDPCVHIQSNDIADLRAYGGGAGGGSEREVVFWGGLSRKTQMFYFLNKTEIAVVFNFLLRSLLLFLLLLSSRDCPDFKVQRKTILAELVVDVCPESGVNK